MTIEEFQSFGHIRPELRDRVLTLWIDRPKVRNAMSVQTVSEVEVALGVAQGRPDVQVLVFRGVEGNFCAGGDLQEMARARNGTPGPKERDPLAAVSRRFGSMLTAVDHSPLAVVAVCEGAVLGGGLGLACVADVTLARDDARFGLPETGLGLPPAQIAPFLVRRLGRSQARRMAVTGGRFGARLASEIGLVHETAADGAGLGELLERTLRQLLRGAPRAVATTKGLIHDVGQVEHERLLDRAAEAFAAAARGPEGVEGLTAFLHKRDPDWGRT